MGSDVATSDFVDFKNLLQRPADGLALLYPASGAYGGRSVGDCGYISSGQFCKLFNIFDPPDGLPSFANARCRWTKTVHNNDIMSLSTTAPFSVSTDATQPYLPPFNIDVNMGPSRQDTSIAFMCFQGATYTVDECLDIRRMQQYLVENEPRILDRFRECPVQQFGLLLLYGTTNVGAWYSGFARGSRETINGRIHIGLSDMFFDNHSSLNPWGHSSSWTFSRGPAEPPADSYCAVVRPIIMRRRVNFGVGAQRGLSAVGVDRDLNNSSEADGANSALSGVLENVLDAVLDAAADISVIVGDWSTITQYMELYGVLPDNSCIKHISLAEHGNASLADRVGYLRGLTQRSTPTEEPIVVEEDPWNRPSRPLLSISVGPVAQKFYLPLENGTHSSPVMTGLESADTPTSTPTSTPASTLLDASWAEAVDAYNRADMAEAALPSLRETLKDAQDVHAKAQATFLALFERNKAMYATLSKSPSASSKVSGLNLLKGLFRTSPASPSGSEEAFEASYAAEINAKDEEETASRKVDEMNAEYESCKERAANVSEKFEHVRELAEGRFPPDVAAQSPALTEATKSLLAQGERFDGIHRTVTDLSRACRAAQLSYKHLCDVIRLCDEGRRARLGGKAAGTLSAMWEIEVLHIFQVAVRASVTSQTCLDECLNIMQRYNELLPQDQMSYTQKLRNDGVSQVQSMCEIMSSNTVPRRRGVTREQLDILDFSQKDACYYLKKVAVWLQDQVPLKTQAQDEALGHLRIARRRIIGVWESERSTL